MRQSLSGVVSIGLEVRHELSELGLTVSMVREVARKAAAAKAEALEIDPASAPGTLAYFMGVRAIRMELLAKGWRMSRAGNVESTVNDQLGIQVCFQNVDSACNERTPQAVSGKGAGARKLILDGQAELFQRDETKSGALGCVPTVWVVCVSTDESKLRAEVSCPEAFEGNQFAGFTKRIWVVDEDLQPTPGEIDDPYERDVPVEHEVRILKKR